MSAAALYLELADLLEREIGALGPGARVTSEHELASQHEVSRFTARAALQERRRGRHRRGVDGVPGGAR